MNTRFAMILVGLVLVASLLGVCYFAGRPPVHNVAIPAPAPAQKISEAPTVATAPAATNGGFNADGFAAGFRDAMNQTGEARRTRLISLIQTVDRTNAAAALRVSEGMAGADDVWTIRSRLIQNWASVDPVAAAKLALTLPEGQNRNLILKSIGWEWGLSDPQRGYVWAQGLPQGETRQGAMAGVIGAWAIKHPEDALHAAQQLAGDDQTRAIRAFVMSRARLDPVHTAALVEQLPAGNTRDRAIERLVKTWAEKDATAAAAWLTNQPESAGKQLAIKDIVDATAAGSPQTAWNWALKLTDPLVQFPALQSVAQSWMNQNADDARAAVQASALPADFKQKLLQTY